MVRLDVLQKDEHKVNTILSLPLSLLPKFSLCSLLSLNSLTNLVCSKLVQYKVLLHLVPHSVELSPLLGQNIPSNHSIAIVRLQLQLITLHYSRYTWT